jgi:two-component system, NarL family, sensor kinase
MLKKEELTLLIVLSTIILIFLITVVVIIILRYKIRQRKFLHEKQQLQSQFSQTLLQSQLEIKEQTLQHLAYELHDNLGQVASLIKINLNTLQLNDPIKAGHKIEDTKELIRQLITDLKSLSVSLNSERVTQLGIAKSLENEVGRLNKTGQFEATLQQKGSIPTLDANTTIILYRMAQEIINNMVKHSGAKRISISLTVIENLFTLAFSDDGAGFDLEGKLNEGGSGLMNLHSRAKLIRAQLSIQSSPGSGTKISIELPL